jgi:CRP-like cAMP-binding protein
MVPPEIFLHSSNVMRVISFSAKDVLWLRIFAIAASAIGLPYFYLQQEVLWEPIAWATVFMAINAYHVWRLWLERRPVALSPDEEQLYELTFFPLTRRQFVDFANLGRWADLKAGDVVMRPGDQIREIVVALSECIDARVGEHNLGRFAAGAIVGASALFSGNVPLVDAVAAEDCRVLTLPVSSIRKRAAGDVQLARLLDRIAREDLARKVEHLVRLASRAAGASQLPR